MRYRWVLLLVLALPGCQRGSPSADSVRQLVITPTPLAIASLPNGFRVSDRVFSGGNPDGDAGFAALARLGVKTIVSVDGARPDVEAARQHGLRYVHLPVGYDGIPQGRVLALAKAALTLPGPIYVHCHHGQHRGPAAVAAIQLCTDPTWDAGRAEAWLKAAGTDPRYVGLIRLPRTVVRPTADDLARANDDFPSVTPIPDLARRMVEVDAHWDNLKLVKAADWKSDPNHPDIDPAHEALQLAEHFREAARLESARRRGLEFARLMADAATAAAELQSELRVRPIKTDRADRAFARSAATCTACHDRFRDRSDGR